MRTNRLNSLPLTFTERSRLHHEVDRSLSQSLYGLSLAAQAALQSLDTHPAKTREYLQTLVYLAEQACEDLQELADGPIADLN